MTAVGIVEHQIREVARKFPGLRVVFQAWWGCAWQGKLAGWEQEYEISILYFCFNPFKELDLDWTESVPLVAVLAPPLQGRRDPAGQFQRPPHLYWWRSGTAHALCVFDPAKDEWNYKTPIADTIIPWTCLWLARYELWQVTGKWTGPQRHPSISSQGSLTTPSGAPPAHFSAGAFNYIGQLTGSSASSALMAAASAGSYRPPSSLSWRTATCKATQLAGILTSSPAPRPAASSLWDLAAA